METRQYPETEARGNDLANHIPKMEAHLGFNKVNLIKLKYQFGSAISTQRPDWPSTQPQQRPTGLFNFFSKSTIRNPKKGQQKRKIRATPIYQSKPPLRQVQDEDSPSAPGLCQFFVNLEMYFTCYKFKCKKCWVYMEINIIKIQKKKFKTQ